MSETARRLAALSPEQREKLLARLREEKKTSAPEVPRIYEGPVDRTAPVPLTDAQEAFWAGGSGLFDLGGSGGNVYLEHEVAAASPWTFAEDLSAGLRRLIARHEILRTVILPDGTQRALPEVPPFQVEVENLGALPPEEAERRLDEVRDRMRYGRFRTDRWPLFRLLVHQMGDGRVLLHARFDALLLDGPTRNILENELALVMLQPDRELPPLDISFLDHARALAAFRDSPTYLRCRDYWTERLESLPPLPRLPLARDIGPATVPRIEKRIVALLPPDQWRSLQQRSSREGINPTGLLTAAFAETLAAWNGSPDFLLGVMGVYRPEDHPQINRVIGNFNTLHLLAVEGGEASFSQRAKLLHRRLLSDLDHQHYSGHQVLRELRRRSGAGGRALLPVLFDSVVEYSQSGLGEEPPAAAPAPAPAAGDPPDGGGASRPQTTLTDLRISLPQVLFLCVVLERDGEGWLDLICQATEEILPAGVVPEIIAAYRALLERLATDDAAWLDPSPVRLSLPEPPAPALWETLPGDRILAVPPELSRTLASHGEVLEAGPDEIANPESLAALAARERITVWVSPPEILEAVLEAAERSGRRDLASLRCVVLHGNRVPVSLPARLAALCPQARLYAAWGTGQAPLAAAGHLEAADFAAPAVGRLRVAPLPGHRLQVLDRSRRALPAWVEGDLYAGAGQRLEPTGQRGHLLPDGRIEIREPREETLPESLGKSADPARIEAALERHPGVGRAVVAWRAAGKAPGRGSLVAWIVPRGGARPGAEDLRRHLLGALPEHLVPEAFTLVERLPLTAEGKIDRAALPSILAPSSHPAAADWGELETELAGLWGEVVGQRPTSLEDDFRALGGDSVRAARLMAQLMARFGLEQPLASFLERPAFGHLVTLVNRARAKSAEEAKKQAERSPVQRLRDSFTALRHRILPPPTSQAYGMRVFLVLWFGQLVSAIGSGLGSFALGVWLFQQTRSATSFAMMGAVAGAVLIVMSPFAGALTDRHDRRKLLLLSDLCSGLTTLAVASLMFTGLLEPWHVYPIVALMVTSIAFQGPALAASVSLLVPRSQLARASGMSQTGRSLAQIIGPLAAGALVGRIGYHGVLLIDFATFLFAVGTLLLVRIPLPPRIGEPARASLLANLTFGWTYLRRMPGLFGLLSLFAMTNFCMGMVQAMLTPLILSFATPVELGTVSSAGAAGALLGGLTLAVWGGPRRRVPAILALLTSQALLLFLGGAQPSVPLIALASFAFMFTLPFTNGFNQAILQSKVAPDVQGRVFAVAGMIAAASLPVAALLAGPLADKVFGPMLAPGGALADTVGQVIGTGDGRGVGLLFIVLGAMVLILVSLAALNPRLRRLETEIPDAMDRR